MKVFFRSCPYFGPDGERRGYEIDNFELLITKKYEEASLKDLGQAGVDKSAEESEKEKLAIFDTLQAFQAGNICMVPQMLTRKKSARRKSMPMVFGKQVGIKKWKM